MQSIERPITECPSVTTKQFVILNRDHGDGQELKSLGSRRELLERLAALNTMPEQDGEDVLHGPGLSIQMPPESDPVRQMLMTIVEEEIAWQVIMRLAKTMEWKLLDPATGREFSP